MLIVENWGYVIKKGTQSFKEKMQVQKLLIERMQSIGQLQGFVTYKKDLVYGALVVQVGTLMKLEFSFLPVFYLRMKEINKLN